MHGTKGLCTMLQRIALTVPPLLQTYAASAQKQSCAPHSTESQLETTPNFYFAKPGLGEQKHTALISPAQAIHAAGTVHDSMA